MKREHQNDGPSTDARDLPGGAQLVAGGVQSKASSPTVVVVDDEPRVCQTIEAYLRGLACQVVLFNDAEECLDHLRRNPADIVIADIRMPGTDGLGVLRKVKEWQPGTDVILVTGEADKSQAIEALRLGAFDFFEKPVERTQLRETVRRALQFRQACRERDHYAEQVSFLSQREAERWGLNAFVGSSKALQRVLDDVALVCQSANTSVMVTGESGTGKELVARAIHFEGPRRTKPFVPVNCSAVPANLAESALFGHVKGAFTGAASSQQGCFEHADGGTLFLDEIGDMPAAIQGKLLRVLEDGVVTPVGGGAGQPVDVRVIAATNADLRAKIAEGQFRSDLYYRLAAFSIEIPPLRDRPADISSLATHFVQLFSRGMGMPEPEIAADALRLLQQHTWPGNVRELKNAVERALIYSGGGRVEADHVQLRDATPAAAVQAAAPAAPDTGYGDLPLNLAESERVLIQRALAHTGGNMAATARLLGINRTKLYRRMAVLGQ